MCISCSVHWFEEENVVDIVDHPSTCREGEVRDRLHKDIEKERTKDGSLWNTRSKWGGGGGGEGGGGELGRSWLLNCGGSPYFISICTLTKIFLR